MAELIAKLQKNLVATTAIPQVYRAIISHSSKPYGESYSNFINSNLDVKNLLISSQEFIKKQSLKLNKTEPSSFCDVTFLHQLAHIIFPELGEMGTEHHRKKLCEQNSLEYLLKIVKQNRNEFAHELPELENPLWMENVISNLKKCLEKAKDVLHYSEMDLNAEKNNLDSLYTDIKSIKSNQNGTVDVIGWKLRNEASEELEMYIDKSSHVSLPLSFQSEFRVLDVFCQPLLTVKNPFSLNYVDEVSGENILSTEQSRVVILSGPPGSGKTTFIKALLQSSIRASSIRFCNVEKYDLIIPIECRFNNCKDFPSVVKQILRKTLNGFDDPGQILDALANKKILITVDGFDELGDTFKELIWDIIQFHQSAANVTVIISTRSNMVNELNEHLSEKGLQHIVAEIKEMQTISEKVEMLNMYGQKIMSTSNHLTLSEAFKEMPLQVQHEFQSPLFLAIFCYLYKETNSVNWKSSINVYQTLYNYQSNDMKKKISLSDPRRTAMEAMKLLCETSLKLLWENRFYLTEREVYKFQSECRRDAQSTSEDWDKILSCLFIAERCTENQMLTFNFLHKSVMEYYAGRYLADKLITALDDGVMIGEDYILRTLSDLVGGIERDLNIERYVPIYSVLMVVYLFV